MVVPFRIPLVGKLEIFLSRFGKNRISDFESGGGTAAI